jgi:hypothetical protein
MDSKDSLLNDSSHFNGPIYKTILTARLTLTRYCITWSKITARQQISRHIACTTLHMSFYYGKLSEAFRTYPCFRLASVTIFFDLFSQYISHYKWPESTVSEASQLMRYSMTQSARCRKQFRHLRQIMKRISRCECYSGYPLY